jgi:PAS domain S-box-containing protein/diguanylate cyclase (GGDEF)-like protein
VLVLLLLTALVTVFDLRLAWHSARMLRESERANAQLKREIAEKEHTRQLLRESEQMYRAVLNTTTDAVVLVDEMAVIRYANPAVEQLFGYKPQELVGKTLGLLQPEDLLRPHRLGFGRYLGSGVRKLDWRATETRGRHRDGRDIPLELALGEIALDGKRLFAGFMRDISERKEREKRIARLTRVYAVLSGINGLIVRVRSRRDLFEGACRIAVKDGGFRMAMISLVEGGALRPVASHGIDEGYSQQLHVRLDADDHLGRGPAGTALRDRQARVCNDIANDPDMAPWREAALQRGYRSSATLPLIAGGDLVGCLGLYAAEPRSFDQEEIRLLSELAGDISYALEVIARDERLDYLAYYDPLTQLANQKLFGQRLERMLDAARQRREPLALLVLDLSRFKAVNDVLGHGGGDAVLKLIADRLVSFAGDPEYLARMSGDRFALVIPELGPDGLPPARLARLAVQLGRPINMLGQELRISARTGIALFPDNGADVESLVRNAEAALKMAKHGRESFLFYTPQMSATISLDLSLDSKLRQALEHKEFVVHYQPKIDLDSGSISGAEALIRWHSPQLGTVPPERFVPLLEETGMILEAGRWMMETAAADRARWLRQGLQAPRIAVNVSPVQLRRPDFVETVGSALGLGYSGDAGVDLEVTESMLMTDAAIDKLKRLRQLGLDIAIDDFGTGYSSLAYLARLPVSSIKIDRSFIVGMSEDTDTSNIVAAIIALAHSINLRVVAEGVESPAQLKRLRLLGCDEVQGFLFSAGVPAEAFARMLREERKLALA